MNQDKILLCIEDDEDDISLIKEVAAEIDSSIHFIAKTNGNEAIMYLSRQKEHKNLPCLILLDMNMPKMSGKDVLVALHKDEVFKNIPVVVFTTSSHQRDQLICESFGVKMVTKPSKVTEIKNVLNHLLSKCLFKN